MTAMGLYGSSRYLISSSDSWTSSPPMTKLLSFIVSAELCGLEGT